MKAVIKYGLLTIAGVALYLLAREYALAERSYEAVGGEVFLLGLPLIWYAVESTIRDTAAQIHALRKELFKHGRYERKGDQGF